MAMPAEHLTDENQAQDPQETQIEQVRQRCQEYMERTGMSQNALAKVLGISPTRLSQFLAGTYRGDLAKTASHIDYGLRKILDQAAAPEPPPYAETRGAREVMAVCDYAHRNRTIGIIHGEAGLGKSMGIRQYQQAHPDTVIVTADPTLTSMLAILEELALAVGVRIQGSSRRLRKAIAAALKGSGRLIVIDEAQHLSYKAMDTLRAVFDEALCGFVFAGSDDFYALLRSRSRTEFSQFYSRVSIRRCLQAQVSMDDVRLIFAQHALSSEALSMLHQAANAGQGLRGMVKTYVFAANFAASQGMPVGPEHLHAAAVYLTA